MACVSLCLPLTSCGDEQAVEPDCVPAVQVGETLLLRTNTPLARDLPPRTGDLRVTGVCQKAEQTVETRREIPPTAAVFPAFPYERGHVATDAMYAVRGHPLHRSVYGSDRKPDLTSGRKCRPVASDAEAVSVDPGGMLVERNGRDVVVRAESRTVIEGPVVDGASPCASCRTRARCSSGRARQANVNGGIERGGIGVESCPGVV